MTSHFKISRIALAAVLLMTQVLHAEDAPLPPDVKQRLVVLKAGYEIFVLNNCTQPYEKGIVTLNAKASAALEREKAAAAKRTDLDVLVRTKSDLERMGKKEFLTDAEAPPPDALKPIYAAYKLELAKLEAAKKASLADARQRYDAGLSKVQNELTAAQQVEAALHVKKVREEMATAEPPPANVTPAEETAAKSPQDNGANLLLNGSFQKGTSKWEMTTHNTESNADMAVDKKVLFHDKPTLRVVNPALTDTHITQKVKVKPNTRYRLSAFIKTEGIKDAKGRGPADPPEAVNGGASICIAGKRGERSKQINAADWTEASCPYTTLSETEVTFECRLGYFGATAIGKAWFAEVSLTEVKAEE